MGNWIIFGKNGFHIRIQLPRITEKFDGKFYGPIYQQKKSVVTKQGSAPTLKPVKMNSFFERIGIIFPNPFFLVVNVDMLD